VTAVDQLELLVALRTLEGDHVVVNVLREEEFVHGPHHQILAGLVEAVGGLPAAVEVVEELLHEVLVLDDLLVGQRLLSGVDEIV
jgi:hypothetical protein